MLEQLPTEFSTLPQNAPLILPLDVALPRSRRREKPLLRGWSHAVAALGAILLTVELGWRSRSAPAHTLPFLLFGLSLINLYTVSAVFHIGTWKPRLYRLLRAFDHANIFLLIACTATPLYLSTPANGARTALLGMAWLLTFIGMALVVSWSRMPIPMRVGLYIALGWVVGLGLTMTGAWISLPMTARELFGLGGTFYTLGALIYATRWPNPFPRYFGYHEVFHVLVIAGSIAFTMMLWGWILRIP